jgi:hypothetical protein
LNPPALASASPKAPPIATTLAVASLRLLPEDRVAVF